MSMLKIKIILIAIIFISICATKSFAEYKFYKPYVDITTKIGNQRLIGSINFMMPISQSRDSLLFADLRTVADSIDNSEGNFGIGYRRITKLLGKDTILGGYGFIDRRRSQFDHYFTQYTLGLEALTKKQNLRFNYYKPVTDDKVLANGTDSAALTPQGFVLVDNAVTLEKSLEGLDVEYGHKIPHLGETWLNAAYYHFGFGDNINLDGIRFRAYTDVNEYLRLSSEASFDNIRKNNYFLEAKIRIPLNKTTKVLNNQDGIYRRMLEPIVRDIDIVTGSFKEKPHIETTPKGNIQKYIFVDNSVATNGDGTPSNPFDNLNDAAAATTEGSTIFVRKGDSTTTKQNTGIFLNQEDMRFIGSGVNLLTRNGVLVESATTKPAITNSGGDAVTIQKKNIEVAGFNISSPSVDGVYDIDFDKANIHDNIVTNAGNIGIHMFYTQNENFNATISNNTVTGSSLYGLKLRTVNSANLSATLDNNISNSNTKDGIKLEATMTSTLNPTLTSNTTNLNNSGASNAGLLGVTANSANMNIKINGHTANNNTTSGVQLVLGGGGNHTVIADSISASNNGYIGIIIDTQDNATTALTYTNGVTQNNTNNGLVISAFGNSIVTGSLSGHSSTSDLAKGIEFISNGTSPNMNLTVSNINVTSSALDSLAFNSQVAANLDITLSGSTILNSGASGVTTSALGASSLKLKYFSNVIGNSTLNNISILNSSTGTYNIDLGGGSLNSIGQNSFRSFGSKQLLSSYSGTISAQNNWWNSVSGLNIATDTSFTNGGNIDATNFLTSNPN